MAPDASTLVGNGRELRVSVYAAAWPRDLRSENVDLEYSLLKDVPTLVGVASLRFFRWYARSADSGSRRMFEEL